MAASSAENIYPGEEEFKARSYQLELFQKAIEENTIVCLKTGAGKTHIAVMVIKEYQHEVLKSYEAGKRSFFLVPKVPLVEQQAQAIANHTCLKVGHYFGAMGVDFWNKMDWRKQLDEHNVLVMTPQILLNLLNSGYMPLSKINLIVFDECHLAIGKSPYCGIMSRYKDFVDRPRILGLSASVLGRKCKTYEVLTVMETLEKTMHCRIQTSSDMVAVNRYSTKPRESILVCKDQTSCLPVETELRKVLDACFLLLNPIVESEKEKKKNEHRSTQQALYGAVPSFSTNLEDSDEEDGYFVGGIYENINFGASPTAILKNIFIVLEQLGVKCASIIIDTYVQDLPNLRRDAEAQLKLHYIPMFNILENAMLDVKRVFDRHSITDDMVTPKVKRVLELFESLSPTCSPGFLQTFRGIVFVECRVTAWILCEFLAGVAKASPLQFGFLKPCYVVGHGINVLAFLKQSSMSVSKQNAVLESFRSGDKNLMVSTKVVEEGLDIPKCNLVVRFDPPKEYCSYVQSMGRARAELSHYVLLVSEADEASLVTDLARYKMIDQVLQVRCNNRPVPAEVETFEFYDQQHKLPPFYPTTREGACLTMNTALSTLNMYLSHLPCDRYTVLVPLIQYRNFKRHGAEAPEIRCMITMPVGCPLRGRIAGDPMPNIEDAKRAAGYLVCKLLFEIDELNSHLLPCVNYLEKYMSQLGISPLEDVPTDAPIPGTNKRRLIYDKRIAVDLRHAYPRAGRRFALHLIHVQKESDKIQGDCGGDGATTTFDAPRCCFGILTSKPISDVCPFGLYAKCKYVVHFEQAKNFDNVLSNDQLTRLEFFHQTVFDVVLRLVGSCMTFRPQEAELSFLVVPVRKSSVSTAFEIDWDSVHRTEIIQHGQKNNTLSASIPEVGSIIQPLYGAESICSKRYVVRKIRHEMTPLSLIPFPKNHPGTNYKSYFELKYNVRVLNDNQPLLEVNFAPNSMNLLLPTKLVNASSARETRRNQTLHLIPALMAPLPLFEEAFQHAFFLPSVLQRLNGLLLASQLTDTIVNEARVADAMVKSDDDRGSKSLLEEISSRVTLDDVTMFCSSDEVPNSVDGNELNALVFQALTTRSAGCWNDLERFEVIGDSFLKFVVSVFLYCEFDTATEGCLTVLRTALIRNSNLSFYAKKKNLPEIINASMLQARTNWLPPCYVIGQQLVEQLVEAQIPSNLWPFADAERPSEVTTSNAEWKNILIDRYLTADFSKRDSTQQPIIDLTSKCAATTIYTCKLDNISDSGSDSEQASHQFSYDHYRQHLISDKTVADSVEALIGVVLASCGQAAALRLVNWFGLRLDPKANVAPTNCGDVERLKLFHWNPHRKTALLVKMDLSDSAQFDKFYAGLNILETQLDYTFKDISFLREALVHPSFSEDPVTNNYQKLEFLGDAILDYLITMHIFNANPHMSPGDMTDLRSSLVDNATFAFLAVKWGLHKHLRYKSMSLHQAIDKYLRYHKRLKDPKDAVYMIGEDEVLELDDVQIPKALGDVFESVAGAIYVDSGFSLKVVWKIFYPLLKELIELYSMNLPINPVRKLFEMKPNVKFIDGLKHNDVFVMCIDLNGKSYTGSGRTRVVAKQAAAKCALRDLQLKARAESTSCRMK